MNDLNLLDNVIKAEERISVKEQILGKGLFMPFNASNSGSRKLMLATQLDHRLELLNPERPLISTGYENKFGQYASSVKKADDDYVVVAKVDKFLNVKDHHYYLIVKNLYSNTYDVLERISYNHITETYGYMHNNNYIDNLKIGSVIKKDTIVKKSTSYDDHNNRMDGVNLITTYLSNEDTKEDGIVISKSAAVKLASPLLKKVSIIVNDNDILLNMYGDDNVYKTIPDIGEEIKDGILCAMRREKKEESLFSQSLSRLKNLMMSDEKYIVKGTVIDIDVYCNNPEMLNECYHTQQLKYYYNDKIRFMNELVNIVKPIIEDKNNKCSYELQKLYYDSKRIVDGGKYIKDKPFSNIILDITILEKSIVDVGDKISNRYGGKGVVSKVRDDELMPLLETGERVEVIFNSSTCVNRENMGQLFETSLGHISSKLIHYMSNVLDSDDCIEMYCDYVSIVSPKEGEELRNFLSDLTPEAKQYFFDSVVSDDGIALSSRPLDDMNIDIINRIYQRFPYVNQYKVIVPQIDSNGNVRYLETRRRLTCGKQYFYRLKQYAEEKFSATSLSSTNIRNENSRSSAKKSYKTIFTKTPVKFGEMETGNLLHLGAENVAMNLLLYSASPKGRRLAEELLTGDPFNIDIKLDDSSTNRGVEILNAYLLTMGLRIEFVKIRKNIKSPIKYTPIIVPIKKTPIWFVNPDDKTAQIYLDNFGKKSKSPIKFVPISFRGRG